MALEQDESGQNGRQARDRRAEINLRERIKENGAADVFQVMFLAAV